MGMLGVGKPGLNSMPTPAVSNRPDHYSFGTSMAETAGQAQIQELMLHKLAPNTRRAWFRSLTNFRCSLGRSPDTAEASGLEK